MSEILTIEPKRSYIRVWCQDDATRNDPSSETLSDAVVRHVGSMYDCARVFSQAPEHSREGVHRPTAHATAKRLLGPAQTRTDEDDCLRVWYRNWMTLHTPDGDELYMVIARV